VSRWKWLLGLSLVALIVAGAYVAGSGTRGASGPADPNDADTAAYDFEASTVVVRQMDAAGRVQYQINAARVTQLPRDGAVSASDLTMHYDPPQAPADGSKRWTLTAQSAQLPESSDVVELQGRVRVQGKLAGSQSTATFVTESFDYNLGTQEISTSAPVEMQWGGTRLKAEKGLRANIRQGTVVGSSANGQFVP
jgi:LPS export ABC transporter protein LptC